MSAANRFFRAADGLDGEFGDLDDWRLGALCRTAGVDLDIFYAPAGETHRARRRREEIAKQICAACPVRARCARYALAHEEVYGVWGGLTEHDRRELRRERSGKPRHEADDVPMDRGTEAEQTAS